MNGTIMQLEMKKAEYKRKLEEYEIKLIRLMNELSSNSIPYFERIDDIKAVEIEQIGDELLKIQKEALDCKKRLESINRELGCD